jgi:hypothetical protein
MNSQQLFDSLSIDDIDRFVKEGREEDLHLDFKTVSDPGLKKRDDRKNFAIAMSGFANSDGGLIVWGVEARVDSEGVDCACGKSEIPDLSRFVSKLNEYGGSAVSPVVVGVEHKVFPLPGSDNKGFAATFVPASDSGPHMAKLGEDRYYRRSGASFKCMEQFEIADMFGRRPKPSLRLAYHAERPRLLGTKEKYLVKLNIENRGRGSARAPYFALHFHPNYPFGLYEYGVDGNGNHGLPRLVSAQDGWIRFGASGDIFIHPGTVRPITAVIAQTAAGQYPPSLALDYEICAENYILERGILEISQAEMINQTGFQGTGPG